MKLTHPCKDTCSGYSQDCAEQIATLQARVTELEAELRHQSRMFIKLQKLVDMNQKVVDAAREVVFGQSADSIDSDEYPALEKALRERDATAAILSQ